MIIKDAMVLIHLAKITVLKKSCDFFKKVTIPEEVYNEIKRGEEKGYEDAHVIEELITMRKIEVKQVKKKELLDKARYYNIQRGEAEAVALYWEERADYLATDDDNIRKKAILLDIKILGTPSIIVSLFKNKLISRQKYYESINELKKIGWFNSQVIDKMRQEAA